MKRILLSSLVTLCIINSLTAQPTAGLLGYWPMDGNFNDLGPYTINGTNTAATATTNRFGSANKAMAFVNPGGSQPTYQWGTLPINSNLNFSGTQDFTISLWVFCNSTYYHAGGLFDNNLNRSGPGVWWWVNPFPSIIFNYKNAAISTPNGALILNVWQHITCVRFAGQISTYINGVQVVSGAEGTNVPTFPIGPRIGSMSYDVYNPPQYNGHNGKIDELRIYNRALSQAEITVLAVLPVKLNFFNVTIKDNKVTLQWQTAQEQNSRAFEVQRSIDGINFIDVATVAAAGNSSLPLSYAYNDLLPATLQTQKTVFYRLRSVDIDGKFSLSQVAALQLQKKDIDLLIFPNPATELLQVQTGNGPAGDAVLFITDASGRQLYKKEIVLLPGSNTIPVNISILNKGIYTVRLVNGNDSYVKQFVKE